MRYVPRLSGARPWNESRSSRGGDAKSCIRRDCRGDRRFHWESKFGGSAWAYCEELASWYLHLYDRSQADLNWDNPQVRQGAADVVSIESYRDVESHNWDRILRERGASPAEALAAVKARSRDNARVPLPWRRGHAAGFTSATPWLEIP
ncbi:MAG: alpha-amylase family glycosyl hydrolase [Actinomycetaceae bacterium]|nr:alpha-amylase family glycosyl hydrolase [Actinomycetaceae bacterium]